jgi:hypothetical protein
MDETEETIMEYDSTKELVESILKKDEKARNSDKELIYRIMAEKTPESPIMVTKSLWDSMPSFESITRCRRKLQEKGLYLPTDPKVRVRRHIKEEGVREWSKR